MIIRNGAVNQSQPTFFADVQVAAERQRRIFHRSFTSLRSVQDDRVAVSSGIIA